jgi:hypothetical protein
MNATVRAEDQSGHISAQCVIKEAELKHLFTAFQEVVEDFRSLSQEPHWHIHVEVEEAPGSTERQAPHS